MSVHIEAEERKSQILQFEDDNQHYRRETKKQLSDGSGGSNAVPTDSSHCNNEPMLSPVSFMPDSSRRISDARDSMYMVSKLSLTKQGRDPNLFRSVTSPDTSQRPISGKLSNSEAANNEGVAHNSSQSGDGR